MSQQKTLGKEQRETIGCPPKRKQREKRTYVPELLNAILVSPTLSSPNLLLAVLKVLLGRSTLGSRLALRTDLGHHL